MRQYKVYTLREFEKILKRNGFVYSRQTGDHLIWKDAQGRHISIPLSRELHPLITKRLIKENSLEV